MNRTPLDEMQVLAMLLAGVLIAIQLTGCGMKEISWKEEVKLQSGEVLLVARTAKTKPVGAIGDPAGWENEGMSIQALRPAGLGTPPIWNAKFVPLVFDRDSNTNEWFIIATFITCDSWYQLGRPRLPYTEFRLSSGVWRQQSLSPNLIGRKSNLLTRIHSAGEPDHTISSKESIDNNSVEPPEFGKIVDEWSSGGC